MTEQVLKNEYDRDPLLVERQSTHGNFGDNARISQELKAIVYREVNRNPDKFTYIMREALDVKCLKWSRILSGQTTEPGHWIDDIGYSKLVLEEIESNAKKQTS